MPDDVLLWIVLAFTAGIGVDFFTGTVSGKITTGFIAQEGLFLSLITAFISYDLFFHHSSKVIRIIPVLVWALTGAAWLFNLFAVNDSFYIGTRLVFSILMILTLIAALLIIKPKAKNKVLFWLLPLLSILEMVLFLLSPVKTMAVIHAAGVFFMLFILNEGSLINLLRPLRTTGNESSDGPAVLMVSDSQLAELNDKINQGLSLFSYLKLYCEKSSSITFIHSTLNTLYQKALDLLNHMPDYHAPLEERFYQIRKQHEKKSEDGQKLEETEKILEDITEKGKIISSGIINITSIMDEAEKNVQHSRTVLQSIKGSLKKIKGTVRVIDKIAEDAHVLAMNASIESAGNPYIGDGFQVVSTDLRDLARDIKKQTEAIEAIVREVNKDLEAGTSATNAVYLYFHDITRSVEVIFSLTIEIITLTQDILTSLKENLQLYQTIHRCGSSFQDKETDLRKLFLSLEIQYTMLNDLIHKSILRCSEEEIFWNHIHEVSSHQKDILSQSIPDLSNYSN